jgi:hypothetical protein
MFPFPEGHWNCARVCGYLFKPFLRCVWNIRFLSSTPRMKLFLPWSVACKSGIVLVEGNLLSGHNASYGGLWAAASCSVSTIFRCACSAWQCLLNSYVCKLLEGSLFQPSFAVAFLEDLWTLYHVALPVSYGKLRQVLQRPSLLLHNSCVVPSFSKLNPEVMKGDEYSGQHLLPVEPG